MMRRSWQASTTAPPPRRGLRVIVLLGAAGVVMSACVRGERMPDTAVMASGADLESANPLVTVHPAARQVQRYVLFVTLARYDDSLRAVPYYARRWNWSADRRTLSFALAPGLRWQDGAPTTAADAAFTIRTAANPATGYARFADLAGITAVQAPDDTTLVLRFARPQPSFPLVLCELPIVPRHLLAGVAPAEMRHAAFNDSPVGNGPFRFVSRRPGQRWVFERNDEFPAALGGPPALRGFVVAVVDEATTKFAGLVAGDLDVAGISPTMASLVRRDSSLRLIEYPVLFTTGIIFNVHKPPFDDPRVRRAIASAVDRRRLISAALAGYGVPAFGPVPPDHPFALTAGPRLDTARADALLDAAGWRRGADGIRSRARTPLVMELLAVPTGDNAVVQLLQADMAAVGIRLEVRLTDPGAFLAAARATPRRFDALLAGIPGDVSLAYLSSMYDSRLSGGALDYAGFHTARLDSLLAAARTASGDSARSAWGAVQTDLASAVPAAWLYHSRGVQGVRRRLGGVVMDLRGELVSVARWHIVGPARGLAAR